MKYICIFVIVLFLSCKQETKQVSDKVEKEIEVLADDLEIYDFNGLQKYLNKDDNKTYVVNFWATWCAPCVKELPYFEKLNADFKCKNVEVILVSLDFPKQYDKKLKPFIKENNLQSKVIALNDTDSNTWIPKIDKDWSGAIPATIIYNKDKRGFYEQSFDYETLKTEVNKFLN